MLTSATLSEDITKLKRLILHNPVTLKLEEPALPEATQLTQYQIRFVNSNFGANKSLYWSSFFRGFCTMTFPS